MDTKQWQLCGHGQAGDIDPHRPSSLRTPAHSCRGDLAPTPQRCHHTMLEARARWRVFQHSLLVHYKGMLKKLGRQRTKSSLLGHRLYGAHLASNPQLALGYAWIDLTAAAWGTPQSTNTRPAITRVLAALKPRKFLQPYFTKLSLCVS